MDNISLWEEKNVSILRFTSDLEELPKIPGLQDDPDIYMITYTTIFHDASEELMQFAPRYMDLYVSLNDDYRRMRYLIGVPVKPKSDDEDEDFEITFHEPIDIALDTIDKMVVSPVFKSAITELIRQKNKELEEDGEILRLMAQQRKK